MMIFFAIKIHLSSSSRLLARFANSVTLSLFISLMLLLAPFSLAQAAPFFQAAGAVEEGTGAVSPAWPAHAIDDIALLFVESTGGQAATLSTPAGFVEIANSPQATGTGTNGTRLTAFWARATSTAMATPTVADPGDHVIAQILTYRGAITTGDPWDVTGGGVKATISTSVNATGVTTTVNNTLIIVAISQDDDSNFDAFSGWTNTNLTSHAERVDTAENTGGGNGGGFGVSDGVMTTAGATGDTTATVRSSVNAFLTIALQPPVAGTKSQLAFAQQPTNTAAGNSITPAITVQIQDASGNLVTTATDTVTIAIGTDPSSGVALLNGTLSVAAVAGVATFSDLDIDTGGTGYTLAASATGLTGATSTSFDITTPSGTYGENECAASRYGADLVCTAGDVSITGIAIVPGSPTKCVGGDTYTVDLDLTINFATPDRWDIGIFLSEDGNDPQDRVVSGGASSCSVGILPTTSPFLDLDSNGGADTCGDGNGAINGGTGSGVLRMNAVPVACKATNLSNGNLFIPFVVTWDNQSTTPGNVCNSILDPVPNTKSKCNAPNGTVAAEVQFGTIQTIVLPDISKDDSISTITAGDSTTYAVVVTNTTGAQLNNAIFRDPAVANLNVNSLSCSASSGTSCPASYPIAVMQGGGILLEPMAPGSSVTFSIGATVDAATPAGTITNTASVIVRGESNSASDTNDVTTKFNVAKAFAPASISAGGASVMSITLENTNLSAATNVTFNDAYPAGLVNTATPSVANSCGGTATAVAGESSLILSGATLAAGATCTVTANVTSAVAGAYDNNTGPISSDQYSGEAATATLAVGVSSLQTATKTWQDLDGGEADPGDTVRYFITIPETAGSAASGVSFSDTLPATLSGAKIVSCPAGATCNVAGQTVTATNITIPPNGSVVIVFDATIQPTTPPATAINNCASISNPGGIGASPCASTITVSPSAVAQTGNKPLYLDSSTTMSRTKPAGTPAPVTIASGSAQTWSLAPALVMPVTISPTITPLAILPVNLYLASDVANANRTAQVTLSCSGGGTSYSQTMIFDGTALNNPYLPTSPTQVLFNNLPFSANQTCAAGQTWDLTVSNISGAGNVTVYPVSGGYNSYLSLPSLSVINVDSVNSYSAAYPAVTTPAGGAFSPAQTVYVRAVVSDPFGSYDITSATIDINRPDGTPDVTAAVMTEIVAAATAATKTYEYSYVVPSDATTGNWTVQVDAPEGTELSVIDSGIATLPVVMPMPLLTIMKSASTASPGKASPGEVITYTVTVLNSGIGGASQVHLDDDLSSYTAWSVDPYGTGSPFQLFQLAPDPDGAGPQPADSGVTLGTPVFYDANNAVITPTADSRRSRCKCRTVGPAHDRRLGSWWTVPITVRS